MGLSFGEILVLAIVALIVIGPKDLPRLLRTAGRTIGTVKRALTDIRKETGLDDVLRGDFEDLERLADHIERMDGFEAKKKDEPEQLSLPNIEDAAARREREFPRIGADAMGMLPEDTQVYADLPRVAAPEGVVATDPRAATLSPEEGATPSGEVIA